MKLAYRKSIRQSRIQDAKEAKEREAKVAAEAEAEAAKAESGSASDPNQPPIGLDAPGTSAPPLHVETEVTPKPAPNEDADAAPSPEKTVVTRPSPTLGIPGSFPMASPSLQPDENVPQSAVSTKSDITEFDNEPQEDMDPQTPFATVPGGLDTHQFHGHDLAVEGRCDQEQSWSVETAAEATPKHPHTFADRHSETLEDTPDQLVVEIGLDLGNAPSENVDTPRADHDDPSIPGTFEEEKDVIRYTPDSYESRVRILRRESDASQHSHSPFPEYAHDNSEYTPGLDAGDSASPKHPADDNDTLADGCVEATDEAYVRNDTYYSPKTYLRDDQDDLSSRRTSTCESLDATHPDGGFEAVQGVQQPANSSHRLGVPTMLSSGNRSSQHSSWTDLSIDSSEPSDGLKAGSSESRLERSELPKQVEMYPEANPITEEDSPTHGERLQGAADVDVDSEQGGFQSNMDIHQLPGIDTGDGFSVNYLGERPLEQDRPGQVPLPLHEPPRIPAAAPSKDNEQHHTPSSSTYGRQSSTWMGSEHPSEDHTLETSAASSILQGSLDVAEPIQGDKLSGGAMEGGPDAATETERLEPSNKEKQRLIQRRNVIKELIDTEAVFVRDMNIVEEIYKGTAEACPKLDANTVKLIFRNTDEIISFHSSFLAQLKEAVAPVYQMSGRSSTTHLASEDSRASAVTTQSSGSNSAPVEPDDEKDRLTSIGPVFKANLETMKGIHEGFLRTSDHAAKRLIQIQEDRTVKVWLNECNEVAMDLTAAWDLDSLLIKPMQRITKYPNIIISLLQHTPEDHPDRRALIDAKESIETAIIEINKTKKNFELVGQIVGRKRKESDVKAGFARAFGKRVDKLQASNSRVPDDAEYNKLRERFNDDYLRLQVVLRDVEFYTRQVTAYVHEFLQYLSSIELVMRLQSSPYPEVESKWVQFNVSMRDIQKVALEQHVSLAPSPHPGVKCARR